MVLSSIILLSLLASFAVAADYVTLEPGIWGCLYSTDANCTANENGAKISTTNLGDFLSKVFNFGIAIAVALSVIMITVGGIQYMTTDSWNKKEEGKERIRNAFYGLALALVSWLILFTINPCLVEFVASDHCKSNNTLISK